MSPRLTDEQLSALQRLCEQGEANGWHLGDLIPLAGAIPSLLSEVRRARLKEPYVGHKETCHLVQWHGDDEGNADVNGSCGEHEDEKDCPGCTCGLSALEASE